MQLQRRVGAAVSRRPSGCARRSSRSVARARARVPPADAADAVVAISVAAAARGRGAGAAAHRRVGALPSATTTTTAAPTTTEAPPPTTTEALTTAAPASDVRFSLLLAEQPAAISVAQLRQRLGQLAGTAPAEVALELSAVDGHALPEGARPDADLALAATPADYPVPEYLLARVTLHAPSAARAAEIGGLLRASSRRPTRLGVRVARALDHHPRSRRRRRRTAAAARRPCGSLELRARRMEPARWQRRGGAERGGGERGARADVEVGFIITRSFRFVCQVRSVRLSGNRCRYPYPNGHYFPRDCLCKLGACPEDTYVVDGKCKPCAPGESAYSVARNVAGDYIPRYPKVTGQHRRTKRADIGVVWSGSSVPTRNKSAASSTRFSTSRASSAD